MTNSAQAELTLRGLRRQSNHGSEVISRTFTFHIDRNVHLSMPDDPRLPDGFTFGVNFDLRWLDANQIRHERNLHG